MDTNKPKDAVEALDVRNSSPLSSKQRELYEAMKGGAICHFRPYAGRFTPTAYYFRNDTMKRCTATAESLLKRGLVEKFGEDWRGHKLRIAANTQI